MPDTRILGHPLEGNNHSQDNNSYRSSEESEDTYTLNLIVEILEENNIQQSDIIDLKVRAVGGYSTIYKFSVNKNITLNGKEILANTSLVLKKPNSLRDMLEDPTINDEYEALSILNNNPNSQIYVPEVYAVKSFTCIIMEDIGEVINTLQVLNNCRTLTEYMDIVFQIIRALNQCNLAGIIHPDISINNLVFNPENENDLTKKYNIILDFGSAVFKPDSETNRELITYLITTPFFPFGYLLHQEMGEILNPELFLLYLYNIPSDKLGDTIRTPLANDPIDDKERKEAYFNMYKKYQDMFICFFLFNFLFHEAMIDPVNQSLQSTRVLTPLNLNETTLPIAAPLAAQERQRDIMGPVHLPIFDVNGNLNDNHNELTLINQICASYKYDILSEDKKEKLKTWLKEFGQNYINSDPLKHTEEYYKLNVSTKFDPMSFMIKLNKILSENI